jgi:DNA processing protein
MRSEALDARIRLSMVSGLGPRLTQRLEEAFGDPVSILHASTVQLRGVEGIGPKLAEGIRRSIDEADTGREWELIEQTGAHVIAREDEGYPALLKHIHDPPPLLFVRGELRRTDAVALAVVGSRKCTAYGREQAERLAGGCAQAGLCIVSGGARGIDTAAHRAAMRVKGRTIAVLGCGLGECYPPENAELFDAIAAKGGAVISELPMSAPPIAENFPRRNRIISGLSLGVLVVEAAARSGALITARLAAEEHHREVLAVPGRIDSPASAGCHKMIREGWAALVTSAAGHPRFTGRDGPDTAAGHAVCR